MCMLVGFRGTARHLAPHSLSKRAPFVHARSVEQGTRRRPSMSLHVTPHPSCPKLCLPDGCMAMIAGPFFARAETKLVVGTSLLLTTLLRFCGRNTRWKTLCIWQHGRPTQARDHAGVRYYPEMQSNTCCAEHRAELLRHWPLTR